MGPPGMPNFRPPGGGPGPMVRVDAAMRNSPGGGGMSLPGPPGSLLPGPPGGNSPAVFGAVGPPGGALPGPPQQQQKKDMLEELLGHKSIRDRQKTEK